MAAVIDDRPAAAGGPALEVRRLSRRYGGVRAVDGVSLAVAAGARHAVIGPNGAGKSTLFALMAGARRPTGGTVHLAGTDVTRLPEHRRARRGLARTFQHATLFGPATVAANVAAAAKGPLPAELYEAAKKRLAR